MSIASLVQYAVNTGLISECDRIFAENRLLEIMHLSEYDGKTVKKELPEILFDLTEDAVKRGVCEDNSVARDLFDTALMGALTPFPHEVRAQFSELYESSPETATDWFYAFSQDTNYIRRDRIKKDLKWTYPCEYGELEITVNLSKPEKDPKAIAAAKNAPQSGYPKCQLCAENEGYAGRMNHPARQNHRIIPLKINGSDWFFQYSPYVYYNEHCIVFNGEHIPMKIDRACFCKLLDFVSLFPHYFVGSNADLPIVGGSILSHDHFQGGRHEFAMAKSPILRDVSFAGFEDVKAGIVKWALSTIRLESENRERLTDLADKILSAWRKYSDEKAFIFAESDGEKHNTITPVASKHGKMFRLDLILRNNITTSEHPLGVFHPHKEFHHIKKENIGLIEAMGLAVLPSRLKNELFDLKNALISGEKIEGIHAFWAQELAEKYTFTMQNADEILKREVGEIFKKILENCGVFKLTPSGTEAFSRFIQFVNKE